MLLRDAAVIRQERERGNRLFARRNLNEGCGCEVVCCGRLRVGDVGAPSCLPIPIEIATPSGSIGYALHVIYRCRE
jgi:hypothetical protein